ncbi:MAG: hypothetical protein K0Q66_1552 [Chitinophagaceae bacterium]|jgi:hypothetical protein|nr:hypothetical protein [Chitinophagaceae bacterium]
MKKIIGLLLILLSASIIQAQTRDELFAQLNSLVAKAKGKKLTDSVSGMNKAVGEQFFSEDLVTMKERGQFKQITTEWVTHHTKMPWSKIKDVNVMSIAGTRKLCRLMIRFSGDKPVSVELYTSDKAGGDGVYASDRVDVYILKRHTKAAKKIMSQISTSFGK